jgi:DNA-binding NtrC family response regulator
LLDTVADPRLEVQANLLRVLETRHFFPVGASAPLSASARVVAAALANPQ